MDQIFYFNNLVDKLYPVLCISQSEYMECLLDLPIKSSMCWTILHRATVVRVNLAGRVVFTWREQGGQVIQVMTTYPARLGRTGRRHMEIAGLPIPPKTMNNST